jgi:ribosome biogenesis GTPase A
MNKTDSTLYSKYNKSILQYLQTNHIKLNHKYDSEEHFKKIRFCPYLIKLMILGEVGLGKSSLANKMAGTHYIRSTKDQIPIFGNMYPTKKLEIFESGSSANSITKKTSFVLTHYLGLESQRIVMLIDTPGFFDPEQAYDEEEQQDEGKKENQSFCKEMTVKLKMLKNINGFLILLAKDHGGRMTLNIKQTIVAINKMFTETEGERIENISLHVALAYTKCDEGCESQFGNLKSNSKGKFKELRESLIKNGVNFSMNSEDQLFFLTALNPDEEQIGQKNEFTKLLDFFANVDLNTEYVKNPEKYLYGNSFVNKIVNNFK